MADFSTLPPNMRCRALVGYYLQAWALMEWRLNEFISGALRLVSLEATIVTKNIQFRDKIHIAKTLVDLRLHDEPKCEAYTTMLNSLAGLSPDRNMVAHDMFGPEGDGVRFYVSKAKGKLSFPNTVWTFDTFVQKTNELRDFNEELTRLLDEIPKISLAEQLTKLGVTTQERGSPKYLAALLLRSQESPDSEAPHK